MVSAIVLAAGESRRMGTLKQLLPFGDRTMLETVLDTLLGSRVEDMVVVLGHRWDEVAAVVNRKISATPHLARRVRVTVNPRYQHGMLSSVQWGVAQLSAAAEGFIVALGDQPLVTPQVVNPLVDVFVSEHPRIVIPTYHGKRGHPVLFDAALKPEILSLEGNATLRDVVLRHEEAVREVPCDEEGVVRDVDYPSEYQETLDTFISGQASDR